MRKKFGVSFKFSKFVLDDSTVVSLKETVLIIHDYVCNIVMLLG